MPNDSDLWLSEVVRLGQEVIRRGENMAPDELQDHQMAIRNARRMALKALANERDR